MCSRKTKNWLYTNIFILTIKIEKKIIKKRKGIFKKLINFFMDPILVNTKN